MTPGGVTARDVADLAERWRRRQLVSAVPGRAEHEAGPPARSARPRWSRRRWAVGIRLAWAAVSVVGLLVGSVVLRAVAVSDAAVPVDLPAVTGGAAVTAGATGVPPGVDPARSPASGSTSAAVPTVVVHVVGQVGQPGVVALVPGARVADAITAAGGAGPDADLSALNLARLLVDGEQVVVPRPGEVPPAPEAGAGAGAGSGRVGADDGAAGGGAAGLVGQSGGLLDLNTADVAALDALPGIGPVLAGRIVGWRTEHGRFTSVDALEQVPGIGPAVLSGLRDLVRV